MEETASHTVLQEDWESAGEDRCKQGQQAAKFYLSHPSAPPVPGQSATICLWSCQRENTVSRVAWSHEGQQSSQDGPAGMGERPLQHLWGIYRHGQEDAVPFPALLPPDALLWSLVFAAPQGIARSLRQMGSPAATTGRNDFLFLINCLVCGILLQQHKSD